MLKLTLSLSSKVLITLYSILGHMALQWDCTCKKVIEIRYAFETFIIIIELCFKTI